MFGLGPKELIVLAAILVLLFGSKRIPELARDTGNTVKQIKGVFAEAEKSDGEKSEPAASSNEASLAPEEREPTEGGEPVESIADKSDTTDKTVG